MGKYEFKSKKLIRKNFTYDLINKGKYEEVVLTEDYQHYGMFFLTVFIYTNINKDAPDNARFLLDWVRVERLEEFNDTDIAAKISIAEKQPVKVGPRSKVLWVRGLYDRLYQIDKAVNVAFPKGILVEKYQRDLPKTAEELTDYGTIIMANVPVEKMGIQTRKLYCDWVKSGGHLVILGGSFSLGQGLMKGTFFDDILPCQLIRNNDISKLPANSQITTKEKDFGQILYAHIVKAKKRAHVFATCGKLPLLLSKSADKGRCTVFAGTVLGAPKDDPKAFWNQSEWLNLLKGVIE
jgi:uncharacterized membrane protein